MICHCGQIYDEHRAIDRDIGMYRYENSLGTPLMVSVRRKYLSDESVGLALFSEKIPLAEKAKILSNMTTNPSERKVRGDPAILKEEVSHGGACLGDFATKRTSNLLLCLEIGDSFLTIPPEQWNDNEDYQRGRN